VFAAWRTVTNWKLELNMPVFVAGSAEKTIVGYTDFFLGIYTYTAKP